MELLNKIFIFILFFVIISKIIPKVSADVIIPDCKWNEMKVLCECKSKESYLTTSNDTCNQCLKYKNDPKYYYLWMDEFCKKASISELINKYKSSVEIPLLITIVLELIVFMIRGYRKIKELLNVILVNCISLPVGYLLFPFISKIVSIPVRLFLLTVIKGFYSNLSSYKVEGNLIIISTLIVIEIMVVIFETLFLSYIAKFDNKKRVFITVIISNIVSLVLGLGILTVVSSFLSLPRLL